MVAIFGPRFVNDALDPSHPEYGCLLLDPTQKGSSLRRNSFTTMRQSTHHPYKRDFMRNTKSAIREKTTTILPRQNKQHHKAISNMSLSRLLNNQVSDHDLSDGEDSISLNKAFNPDSPSTTPSPTFRIIPTFDTKWPESTPLLPPIYTSSTSTATATTTTANSYGLKPTESEPRITPVYNSPTWSPVSPISSEDSSSMGQAKDIIDTINATILLQRLSQDDGARPFKPMHPDSIPSKVMVGNQEFRICWDN